MVAFHFSFTNFRPESISLTKYNGHTHQNTHQKYTHQNTIVLKRRKQCVSISKKDALFKRKHLFSFIKLLHFSIVVSKLFSTIFNSDIVWVCDCMSVMLWLLFYFDTYFKWFFRSYTYIIREIKLKSVLKRNILILLLQKTFKFVLFNKICYNFISEINRYIIFFNSFFYIGYSSSFTEEDCIFKWWLQSEHLGNLAIFKFTHEKLKRLFL